MININLQTLLREFNLSELVIFEEAITGRKKIRSEHFYSVILFVEESKKYTIEKFKSETKLSKGQNWKSEYTKKLKERIQIKYT